MHSMRISGLFNKSRGGRATAVVLAARTVAMLFCLALVAPARGAERPNVLWITSEDNSPYLGCYGDPLAATPNLDRLASEGVRYRNAFANAPVCSTARTTLITGMYACSLGAQHHRSRVAIPAKFQLYPELLRAAGYYCTNNAKTDYNLPDRRNVWDENGRDAHYRHRAQGQPFFAVFNLGISHESQVAPDAKTQAFRVAPEKIPLPPYHPDTTTIRRDWANYHDRMTRMDEQAGDLLAELERAGVADNTIVFYFSDHGGALPRGKRNLHDSGTRVPLIVRFPEKWSKFAPAKPGDWDDTLVSFVDFPATLLSLCDTAIPANYEGRPWLGFRAATPRRHVFLFRGRMDERYDTARGVCDGEYRYILNFSPHRPWGQHYAYPFRVLPSMRSWHEEFLAGRCNDVQASYWRPKPAEELYRLADDPHEINNLADDPAHTERLNQLRAILKGEMLATRDTGLIPEGMMRRLAGEQTIYEYAQSSEFPAKTVLELASKAAQRDQATLPEFVAAMNHPHPVPRYWGAMGCLLLGKAAKPAKDALLQRLDDPMFDARVVAAEALATLGETDRAIQSLAAVLEHGQPYEVLAAQNALDALRAAGLISLEQAQQLLRSGARAEPLDRIPQYVLGLRETTAGKKETPASSTRQRD